MKASCTEARGDLGDAPDAQPAEQLTTWRQQEPDIEHRLSAPTPISQELLVTLCRRCGLEVYRPRAAPVYRVREGASRVMRELWPLFKRWRWSLRTLRSKRCLAS